MKLMPYLAVFNYGLILFYGALLSIHISGGWDSRKRKYIVLVLCALLLAAQGLCYTLWRVDTVKKLYPFITHLPLVFILIIVLKKRFSVALVSVCTAYLCCQLPRWISLIFAAFVENQLIAEISYSAAIVLFYILLRRSFVGGARDAISFSTQTVYLFGSLPFVYYVFDYSTVIYSNILYEGIPVFVEFFPTALIIFYIVFLSAYHIQTQKRSQSELEKSILEVEIKQAEAELTSLRRVESQTAIHQHDMRHHLTAISAFLDAGNIEQAEEYIRAVQSDIQSIMPMQFCENELVNLLCSSFLHKAQAENIKLKLDAKLPNDISISDAELSAIISNGLENALHAVSNLEPSFKWIEFYCGIRANKLLVEIRNPYAGEINMKDGLPVAGKSGHGFGCRSTKTITENNGGICAFEPENGIFSMQIIIPISIK